MQYVIFRKSWILKILDPRISKYGINPLKIKNGTFSDSDLGSIGKIDQHDISFQMIYNKLDFSHFHFSP